MELFQFLVMMKAYKLKMFSEIYWDGIYMFFKWPFRSPFRSETEKDLLENLVVSINNLILFF